MLRHFWLSYKNCIKSLQQVVKIVSQTVRGLLLDIEVGTIKKRINNYSTKKYFSYKSK